MVLNLDIRWRSTAIMNGAQISEQQKHGYPDRGDYNQMANCALTETPINIGISNRPPSEYMVEIEQQIASQRLTLGEIVDTANLAQNLEENAVPANLAGVSAARYRQFLMGRRQLMAAAIRRYYEIL